MEHRAFQGYFSTKDNLEKNIGELNEEVIRFGINSNRFSREKELLKE